LYTNAQLAAARRPGATGAAVRTSTWEDAMTTAEPDGPPGAFGGSLPLGARPALLLVDMVNAYLDPDSPLYAGVESTVAPARAVLDAARDARIPVVFTRVVYGPGGTDGGIFFRKVGALSLFVGETEMGAVLADLAPLPGETVVTKQYASAFFGTALASTLTSLGCDTVLITGYSTSGCVRATAVDACQHGFVPLVVEDAVGDRSAEPHEANLYDLRQKYADVLPSADVVAYLQSLTS
jgi:maleamate amidohydrolase